MPSDAWGDLKREYTEKVSGKQRVLECSCSFWFWVEQIMRGKPVAVARIHKDFKQQYFNNAEQAADDDVDRLIECQCLQCSRMHSVDVRAGTTWKIAGKSEIPRDVISRAAKK